MKKEEVLTLFRETEALLEGHFLLTSGLHSPQYFQCAKVLQYPQHAEKLCREIAEHFKPENIEVVISPALGGIIVGQAVARQLGARSIFAERAAGVLQLRRGFEIKAGERVLACEDVVTTGGSVGEVVKIARRNDGSIVGACCIVDRSSRKPGSDLGAQLFSVLRMDVVTYKPEECPLCRQNKPLVKPGSRSV
jgi:orotate phosphoribosyltransferase